MACKSCGMEGVDGICSMCYGDPWHNTDGEYLWQLEREILEESQREHYDEVMHEQNESGKEVIPNVV